MKRALLAILMASCAVPGFAADVPPPATAPVPAPVLYYDWSGVYAGVNVGYGFAHLTETASIGAFSASITENLNGFLAGGQVGAQIQTGSFVFGAELDAQWTGQSNTATIFGVAVTDKIDWFGTARVRAGVAMDRTLVYLTGGGAYGQFTSSGSVGAVTVSRSTNRNAWTLGVGTETAFGNVILRIEYLYLQTIAKTQVISGVTLTDSLSDSITRIGLIYKFGAGYMPARN